MSPVAKLSAWYVKHARPLPWRENHDPYRIWISEVMLQQTQVTTVIPYYHRFLERFPTLEALAKSPTEEVLHAWSGLGYYSRARNLQKGAQFLVDKHGGKFPRTREEILEVPGVGPYTAGAILSIAFDLPEALVDGNVQRVFARYFGELREIQVPAVQKLFWGKAAEWAAEAKSARILNQALMELGATVCTKGTPRCARCPLSGTCVAFREGIQEELPRKKTRRENVELFWVELVLEAQGKLFLKHNKTGEWWADLWGFPRKEAKTADEVDTQFEKWRKKIPKARAWRPLPFQKHTVTHHKIRVAPYLVQLARPEAITEEGRWFDAAELTSLPLSSLARKTLSSVVIK